MLRMDNHRLPERVMSGELRNARKLGPGVGKKEWTDCVAEDRRVFGMTRVWVTAMLDLGV